jgi:hypothetical protein
MVNRVLQTKLGCLQMKYKLSRTCEDEKMGDVAIRRKSLINTEQAARSRKR